MNIDVVVDDVILILILILTLKPNPKSKTATNSHELVKASCEFDDIMILLKLHKDIVWGLIVKVIMIMAQFPY
jgi:hypothetical protein